MGEEGAPEGYAGGNGTEGTPNQATNPAWNEFLSVVPEEYHEKVTPLLKKWDDGVNDRFSKVQSEWDAWKPFKEKFTPEDVNWGLTLAQSLSADPKKLWDTVGEYYGFAANSSGAPTTGQGQGEPSTDNNSDQDPYVQRYNELKSQLDAVTQALLASHRDKQLSQAEAELDKELTAARQKHGEFDEEFVVSMMQNGMSADDAAKRYFAVLEKGRNSVPKNIPTFLGGGGGTPGGNPNPAKMSSKDRRNYVVEMLNAVNNQNK